MDIYQFLTEWGNLTVIRKQEGLQSLFDYLVDKIDDNEDYILDIIRTACDYEQDDYFGTEGLKV